MSEQVEKPNWIKKIYNIEGNWKIKTMDGIHILSFEEDFKTSWGPDVKIFLSPQKIEDIDKYESVDKDGLYISFLKEFSGSQSYVIPEGSCLLDFESLVLHCQAYSVVWGGVNLR